MIGFKTKCHMLLSSDSGNNTTSCNNNTGEELNQFR